MSITATAAARQGGAALIAALFALIVVAALGVVAMRIGSDQQQLTSLQIQRERAYAAAASALEFGINRAFTNTAPCNIVDGLPHSVSFTFTATAMTLNGFDATVTCVRTSNAVGPSNHFVYALEATASRGTYGTPDYVHATAKKLVADISSQTW